MDLQEWLCANYFGEIHVSTGMTAAEEVNSIVEFYEKRGRAKDVVLYVCTSGYPVPFEDLCLREISRFRELYGARVKEIGFSGHHLGIAADIAAMALGATVIERHFTLDRTWKGTDHAASLEPDGMRRLKRDLTNVSKSLTYKARDILEIEEVQRRKLKWEPTKRIVAE
jgi:N-acetylneuraminate synthase